MLDDCIIITTQKSFDIKLVKVYVLEGLRHGQNKGIQYFIIITFNFQFQAKANKGFIYNLQPIIALDTTAELADRFSGRHGKIGNQELNTTAYPGEVFETNRSMMNLHEAFMNFIHN